MKRWGDVSQEEADHLAAESVLDHAEMAVVVTDRFSNLLYWNPFEVYVSARRPFIRQVLGIVLDRSLDPQVLG